MLIRLSTLLMCFMLSLPAFAVDKNVSGFSTPELEARYRHLLEELRCVVCQNQNLEDSNAMLAQDLRNEVRDLLEQGNSDEQVMEFLVKRYSEFVLYRPRWQPKTYLLWGGPALFLVLAVLFMLYFIRQQAKPKVEETQLTPEEQAKLATLLEKDD